MPKPVVVTFVYILPNAKNVLNIIKNHPSELIVSLVEQTTGRECVEVRQTFSGTEMPERVAQYFNLPVKSPSLRILRQYLDEWGRTIVASLSYHPADKFSFSISAKKKLSKGI
ncbi:UTRA domain-containing protein [uncultured Parasutterella sp.]|uniref:UTRA domain-containing protein n=2 Tax=uncultured Parasutterella sp. TaxID=1263098 RepID=UPI00339014DB